MDILKEQQSLPKVWVGCSGAFTIETLLLKNLPPREIVSSDVSIFTNAIGFYLTDQDFDLGIGKNEYQYLTPYIEKSLAHKCAVVLFLQDVSDFASGSNHFDLRMIENYAVEHEKIIEAKVKRLKEQKAEWERSSIKHSYLAKDVTEVAGMVNQGELFLAFPPFYKGGYEKLYKFIDEVIVSDSLRVPYDLFTDESLVALVKTLIAHNADFIIGTNRGELFGGWEKVNHAAFDYFSDSELVTFITSLNIKSRFAKNESSFISPTYGVTLATKEDILKISQTSKIEIREIPLDLFDSIRLTRISDKVKKVADPTLKFGVFVEGKLAGVFGIDIAGIKGSENAYYLLSDIPVENSYDLAKLIAALASSRAVADFIKRNYLLGCDFIKTTAFTDKPEAMKYRNFFKSISRGKTKDGQAFINYQASMGLLHTNDIISKWLKFRSIDR